MTEDRICSVIPTYQHTKASTMLFTLTTTDPTPPSTARPREKESNSCADLAGNDRLVLLAETWGPGFDWLTEDVVYGMFYADCSILDDV